MLKKPGGGTHLTALLISLLLSLWTDQSWLFSAVEYASPYLAHTFGATPVASRIRIGVSGLCFFMVGYARLMNVLNHPDQLVCPQVFSNTASYLAASLACDDEQRWKRTSRRVLPKAYRAAIL